MGRSERKGRASSNLELMGFVTWVDYWDNFAVTTSVGNREITAGKDDVFKVCIDVTLCTIYTWLCGN